MFKFSETFTKVLGWLWSAIKYLQMNLKGYRRLRSPTSAFSYLADGNWITLAVVCVSLLKTGLVGKESTISSSLT